MGIGQDDPWLASGRLKYVDCDILLSSLILYYFQLRYYHLRECQMSQTIDESRAQLIADLQERAEVLTQLNRIACLPFWPGVCFL